VGLDLAIVSRITGYSTGHKGINTHVTSTSSGLNVADKAELGYINRAFYKNQGKLVKKSSKLREQKAGFAHLIRWTAGS